MLHRLVPDSGHLPFQRPSRILVISYHFPPDPAAGARRPLNWVKLLSSVGYDVEVITARYPGDASDGHRTFAGARVHTVTLPPSARERAVRAHRALRDRISPVPVAETAVLSAVEPGNRRYGFLARHLLAWLLLPDDRQGFILPTAQLARRLHAEKPFDLIYATMPPFSVALAARLISRWTKVPWWAEFRDPWVYEGRESMTRGSALVRYVERRLEASCLRSARRIVAATDSIAGLLRSKLSPADAPEKVLVAYNGIPEVSEAVRECARPEPSTLVLLHAGELYLRRDPTSLLRGLALWRRSAGCTAPRIQLHFLGEGRHYRGISVAGMAEELGISDWVSFTDTSSTAAAEQAMQDADVLVLLAQHQPAQVPQKLFEYLAIRRPILALADFEGEAARILRRVGGHVILSPDADEERIASGISAVVNEAMLQRPVGDRGVLETLTSRRQLSAVLASLREDIAAGRTDKRVRLP